MNHNPPRAHDSVAARDDLPIQPSGLPSPNATVEPLSAQTPTADPIPTHHVQAPSPLDSSRREARALSTSWLAVVLLVTLGLAIAALVYARQEATDGDPNMRGPADEAEPAPAGVERSPLTPAR
jgi:hypothetical protein